MDFHKDYLKGRESDDLSLHTWSNQWMKEPAYLSVSGDSIKKHLGILWLIHETKVDQASESILFLASRFHPYPAWNKNDLEFLSNQFRISINRDTGREEIKHPARWLCSPHFQKKSFLCSVLHSKMCIILSFRVFLNTRSGKESLVSKM